MTEPGELDKYSNSDIIRGAAKESIVGKLLPESLYVHVSGLELLPKLLRFYENWSRILLPKGEEWNLVKLGLSRPAVSFLTYPDFDEDPHPPLTRSVRVDLRTQKVAVRDYSKSENPPILHRKELFVPEGYPGREIFVALTKAEEAEGLLVGGQIGLQKFWAELLKKRGLRIEAHELLKEKQDGP